MSREGSLEHVKSHAHSVLGLQDFTLLSLFSHLLEGLPWDCCQNGRCRLHGQPSRIPALPQLWPTSLWNKTFSHKLGFLQDSWKLFAELLNSASCLKRQVLVVSHIGSFLQIHLQDSWRDPTPHSANVFWVFCALKPVRGSPWAVSSGSKSTSPSSAQCQVPAVAVQISSSKSQAPKAKGVLMALASQKWNPATSQGSKRDDDGASLLSRMSYGVWSARLRMPLPELHPVGESNRTEGPRWPFQSSKHRSMSWQWLLTP